MPSYYDEKKKCRAGTYIGKFGQSDLLKIKGALFGGKLVCVGSRQVDFGGILPGVVSVSSPYICGSHVYSVVSVNMVNQTITLRNPWGVDGGSQIDGANDALVWVPWAHIKASMNYLAIA